MRFGYEYGVTVIILGPHLRFVGEREATVWVETDGPCTVSVRAGEVVGRAPTFHVQGHHYALVVLEGLVPDTTTPYTVALDDETAWPPPDYELPPPRIRTLGENRPVKLLFGSCRVAVPHEPPFTNAADSGEWSFERDALEAYARRMRDADPAEWPDLIFLCGDQVYADELSPLMQAEIDLRRKGGETGPPDQAVHFEEYTMLYRDAWSDPVVRWFHSTVPSVMIWDDHDVLDDWNTSHAWMVEQREAAWWPAKIAAAVTSYWIYQHAGNLSPEELRADEVWDFTGGAERPAGDADLWPRFEAFGRACDAEHRGRRWSYRRDLGRTRLVVMDSRGGRQLDPEDRRMTSREEWEWIEAAATGDVDHLLLGTSLPWLLAPAIHDAQRWNEAVAEGAWGALFGRLVGERMRQAYDLEHWPAFGRSFLELAELVRAVGAGERGTPPATITVLSGDVHHAYLAAGRYPVSAGVQSAVWQATCSPIRNPLNEKEEKQEWLLRTRPVAGLIRRLAEAAGAFTAPLTWSEVDGPSFDNQIATLELDGRRCVARIERACGHPAQEARLEAWAERRLDREE